MDDEALFYLRAWSHARGGLRVLLDAMRDHNAKWAVSDCALAMSQLFKDAEEFAHNPNGGKSNG